MTDASNIYETLHLHHVTDVHLLKTHLQQRQQGLSHRNVIFHKTTKLIPAVPFTQNGEIIAFSLFQCGKCDVIGT